MEKTTMNDQEFRRNCELEFRRNCELRSLDEPVTNQQALEALDYIVKNPQTEAEDIRTLNQAVSVLENFIYIHRTCQK